jgi:hypothetical protein
VALLTNTTIRLIRANCKLQYEATKHLRGMPTEDTVIHWFHHGIRSCKPLSDTVEGWPLSKPLSKADWCCYDAQTGLLALSLLANKNQPFEYTLPAPSLLDSFSLSMFLCTSFHNYKIVGGGNSNSQRFPCFDEITSGWLLWEDYLNPERIPLWFNVSLQILMDTLVELGVYSLAATSDLVGHCADHNFLRNEYLSHDHTIKRMAEDGNNIPNLDALPSVKEATQKIPRGMALLHCNPLLCGMQSMWMQQKRRHFEYWAVRLHESIVPAALLYVKMRACCLVDEWPDMESFVCKHPRMLCPG